MPGKSDKAVLPLDFVQTCLSAVNGHMNHYLGRVKFVHASESSREQLLSLWKIFAVHVFYRLVVTVVLQANHVECE